ncbi:MAG: GNAT family N-acetyltransferase [bacterium]
MGKIRVVKLNTEGKKEFIREFKDAPKRRMDDYDFYGVYDGDKIIGGIVINIKPDHFHFKGLGLLPKVIVEFLFVLKEYRNQGIGKKLFDIASKYDSVGLRTGGMTTDTAKNMYTKAGFKVVREKGLVKYWYRGK